MSKESKKLVIYHANCNDGFCAAWVAWRRYPDAEFHGANYNQSPPDVAGRDVLIVDFSYPRNILLQMHKVAASLRVLDHHKTAQADLEGLAFCLFDMNRSGAGLAWDELMESQDGLMTKLPRPWVVDAVEDRDLWRWTYPSSKELNAAITTWPRDFDFWNAHASDDLKFEQLQAGRAILRYLDQYTDEMCDRARLVEFEGYVVPSVNVPYKGISEVCGKLAENAIFSIGWAQEKNGKFVYSLRSRGDFDVSAIAKKYGGGGHKNSAGFNSDRLLF